MLPPDVTIIVNVYNGAKFVAECLDSISIAVRARLLFPDLASFRKELEAPAAD